MSISTNAQRERLTSFSFRELFINPEMGWDNPRSRSVAVLDGSQPYTFERIAEKSGVQVFAGGSDANGAIPNYQIRRRLQREVSKQAHENLIIFTDSAKTEQIWHWIKKEPGQPARARERRFLKGQSGEPILQTLEGIRFSLDEEEELTIFGVTKKLERAFDKDKVTKKFYEQFKTQHDAFVAFTEGIPGEDDQKWYASVMLNRLMFLYFFQQKRFLDNNQRYLQSKLQQVQQLKGRDQFHGFYRQFLRRLFHEGLAQTADSRSSDVDALIGEVPYLNGGIFDEHQLEQTYPEIDIPDEAFEKLFAFFDQYTWHLDERPIANQNEINPDVLGYIFEKYINQKELGAYYTKEDITEYICKNTIIPFLYDAAKKDVTNAFKPGSYLWRLLQENPDDYIYEAVAKGADLELPEPIGAGLDDITKRGDWNRPAAPEFALPTETWREHIARRQRRDEVWTRIINGEITEINGLITFNLDIRWFAEDVIRNAEGPELVRAFYKAISKISVLDPTCGSGAFLFAGLNILEPLYEACLDRMQEFIDSLSLAAEKPHPEKFGDFRETLAQVDQHPNRRYFILKQIILNNLYGVDIVEEAVEICKLRLFLKLVAQLDDKTQIEPLPDIDFNIRCGNTLVGFIRPEEVERAIRPPVAAMSTDKSVSQQAFSFNTEHEFRRIEDTASKAAAAFYQFQEMQQRQGMGVEVFRDAKKVLQKRLAELRSELDAYLARQYAETPLPDSPRFQRWLASHQPFHWYVEFYEIMKNGGFNVIVGNPPYVSTSDVRYLNQNQKAKNWPNIYAHVLDASLSLSSPSARCGMIVPLSIAFSGDFTSLRAMLFESGDGWYSSFDNIPAAVFTGVSQRCTIWIGAKEKQPSVYVAPMYRWRGAYRQSQTRTDSTVSNLTANLEYVGWNGSDQTGPSFGIPRVGSALQAEALLRQEARTSSNSDTNRRNPGRNASLGYSPVARNFLSVFLEPPPVLDADTYRSLSNQRANSISPPDGTFPVVALAAVSGDLSFWYWIVRCDGFHVTGWFLRDFLRALEALPESSVRLLERLGELLHERRYEALVFKKNSGKFVGNFNYRPLSEIGRRADLIVMAGLGFNREQVLDILGYIERVLVINEHAGEKGIPHRVNDMFAPEPFDRAGQTALFAEIDEMLMRHFGFTVLELDAIVNYGAALETELATT